MRTSILRFSINTIKFYDLEEVVKRNTVMPFEEYVLPRKAIKGDTNPSVQI